MDQTVVEVSRKQLAEQYKKDLIYYYLYQRGFMCATKEIHICQEYIADVLAVSDKGVAYEVEVKTDWADFKSELDAINDVLNPANLFDHQYKWKKPKLPKYGKHYIYLKGIDVYLEKMKQSQYSFYFNTSADDYLIPHRFYFMVPDAIIERVVAALQHTPYGVLSATLATKRQAKPLHKVELPQLFYRNMLRKLSHIIYQ